MHENTAPLAPAAVLSRFAAHAGTIPSFLAARAAVQPDKPVLRVEEREWSYRELEEASASLAQLLARRGIGRGARLALVALNSDLSVLLFLAAARLGAVFIPLNPAASRADLEYLLRHSRARLVIAQATEVERVSEVVEEVAKGRTVISLAEWGAEATSASEVRARLREFAAVAPGGPRDNVPLSAVSAEPDDAVVVIYTSGTTGFPKGVVHTHRTYILAAEGFVSRMYLQPDERLLTVMPFFHINALFYSLGGAIACGGLLITVPRFSASRFWSVAAECGATEFNFLAAVGNILINRPRTEFDPRHRITKIYGGPISERMTSVFESEFQVPALIEGYGMSEIPGACCNPFLGPHKAGSIGLPAVHPLYPGAFSELRVVDDEGRDRPAGETGELIVRTPMMFKEYLDDPVQTAAAFRDGWFLTGDLVRCDADGYFYFVARKKDIIRRRGENIAGAELDRVISEHPRVLEAAAVGVPSALGEEEILVVVVPKPGESVTPPDVLEWCRARLAPMKVPRFVLLAESLPHTPSHRVAKHILKSDKSLASQAFDAEHPSAAERSIDARGPIG